MSQSGHFLHIHTRPDGGVPDGCDVGTESNLASSPAATVPDAVPTGNIAFSNFPMAELTVSDAATALVEFGLEYPVSAVSAPSNVTFELNALPLTVVVVGTAPTSAAVVGTVIFIVSFDDALAVNVPTPVPFFWIVNVALLTVGIVGLFVKSA